MFGVLHAILNGRGTQPLRVSLASQNNVTLHHLLAILSVPAANVRALDLSRTNVSDQDIETMARMSQKNMLQLREIRLADVNVTETGLRWLRAIPGLEVQIPQFVEEHNSHDRFPRTEFIYYFAFKICTILLYKYLKIILNFLP